MPNDEIARIGRAIVDLSARFLPTDPGPRPMSKVTAEWEERSRTRRRPG